MTGLLLLYLLGTQAPAKPIYFSRLGLGERIAIRFSSVGCFHKDDYAMEFRETVDGITAEVRSLEIRTDDRNEKERGSSRQLSRNQIEGLDRLLAFYRGNRREGCTTVDRISIVRSSSDGKTIAAEEYLDASCGVHYLSGITLLPTLEYQEHAPVDEDFDQF